MWGTESKRGEENISVCVCVCVYVRKQIMEAHVYEGDKNIERVVYVCVPGKIAGGYPRTPAAGNSTATSSAAAAGGEHKQNISPDL